MGLYEDICDMPLFRHFTEREKREFAMMEHKFLGFRAGEYIIHEGQMSSALYLLLRGNVTVYRGKDVILAKLATGSVFGELSFLSQTPRYSSVIAEDDIRVLKLDETFFEKISPDIRDKVKNYLIELLIKRLDTMNETLVKIAAFARGRMLP